MSKRRKRRAASVTPEALESRTLLTTVTLLSEGTLAIEGTDRSDRVEVSQRGDIIEVKVAGGRTTRVNAEDVNAIGFRGHDGNDYFRNRTSIPSYLRGDAGNDTLIGGSSGDILVGDSGRDDLRGARGDDTIYGGEGNDILRGASGADVISGWIGNDTMFGGTGSDAMVGGNGADRMEGGKHDDRLTGDRGNDTLLGGFGSDELEGGIGNDALNGGYGVDTLNGGDGKDTLNGGGFDNARDHLTGGDDADIFHQWGQKGSWSNAGARGDIQLGEDYLHDFFATLEDEHAGVTSNSSTPHDREIFHKRPKWRDPVIEAPPVGPVASMETETAASDRTDQTAMREPVEVVASPIAEQSDPALEPNQHFESIGFRQNNDVFFAQLHR
jgi:hypothetical protein